MSTTLTPTPGTRAPVGLPVRSHPSAWALWPTVAATWVAFAHVLSFQGMAIWVAGGSLLTALVVVPLAFARRRALALGAMAVMPVVVAVLAEGWGGNTAGPVTRSALMACAVVGAMAVILPTRYPLAVLPASLALLAGALGLGAADQVLWLAGLWAVGAAVTIAMVGPLRQSHLRDRRRLGPFAGLLLLSGLVAVVATLVAAPLLGRPWTIPGAGEVAVPDTLPVVVVAPSASPSASPSVAVSPSVSTDDPSSDATAESAAVTRPSAEPTAAPPAPLREVAAESPASALEWLGRILLILLLLLLLVLLALLLHRAWVWLLWRRLRRRLSSGSPEEQAIGAWTWLRMRRARVGRPLPVSLSPDVAVEWAGQEGDPDVRAVATVAAAVAFNPRGTVTTRQAEESWAAASAADRTRHGTLRQRWAWSGATPRRTSGRMARGGGPLNS